MKKLKALICLILIFASACSSDKIQKDITDDVPEETQSPMPSATPPPTPSPVLLSEFTTTIYDKESEREHNIALAVSAINGHIVKNGDIFSFNDIVGPRTAEKGYLEATVLVDKEKTKGIGGGVCQVSTTLFGATEKAGLEIIERHRHEIEVTYAPDGTDASVNYDNLDFKFRNNSGSDITITAETTGKTVTVRIFTQ